MTTLIGLARDFVLALMGVLLLFGVGVTTEQTGGVALVATTALAFGIWAYQHWGHFEASWETGLGLLRDAAGAVMGGLLLFGVPITAEQSGAVLLLLTTGAAMGTWGYKAWKATNRKEAPFS